MYSGTTNHIFFRWPEGGWVGGEFRAILKDLFLQANEENTEIIAELSFNFVFHRAIILAAFGKITKSCTERDRE